MKVSDVLRLLPQSDDLIFQGNKTHPFKGFRVRHPRTRFPGHFAVLVDESWGPRMTRALKRRGLSTEQRITQALERGYTGILCSTDLANHSALENIPVLHAPHSHQLAESIVTAINGTQTRNRITGITGSFGKTTTKAMLAHTLTTATGTSRVFSHPHSQNLSTDVLSHLSRTVNYRHSVIEVAGGAMTSLVSRGVTVSPDVAILTGISEAHLSYLRNTRGVAEMKSKLLLNPRPGATAIINHDTEHSDLIMRRAIQAGCQLLSYGESEDATVRLLHYDSLTGQVRAEIGSEQITYRIGAKGRHMALNSLGVLAALRAHRLPKWRRAIESLSSFRALEGRGATQEVEIRPGVYITLIDDAYNANPASIRSSLEHLQQTPVSTGSRRIAVLGDMQELGEDSRELHSKLAPHILATTGDHVYLIGEEMSVVQDAITAFVSSMHFSDSNSLAGLLRDSLKNGDILLVKSAHSTGLHNLVSSLKKRRAS